MTQIFKGFHCLLLYGVLAMMAPVGWDGTEKYTSLSGQKSYDFFKDIFKVSDICFNNIVFAQMVLMMLGYIFQRNRMVVVAEDHLVFLLVMIGVFVFDGLISNLDKLLKVEFRAITKR